MKNFKYIFISFTLLLSTISVSGQTNPMEFKDVTYKTFSCPFTYVRYPDKSLGEEYKTMYAIKAVADTVPHADLAYKDMGRILIKGFRLVDADSNPDLVSEILLEGITINEPKVETSEHVDKKRGTTEMITRMNIQYRIKYSVKLTDMRTNAVIEKRKESFVGKWDSEYKYTKGDRMRNPKHDIESRIAAGRKEIAEKVERDIKNLNSGFATKWSNLYGTQYDNSDPGFYTLMDKNHYETYLYRREAGKMKESRYYKEPRDYTNTRDENGDLKQPFRFIEYNLGLMEKYKTAQPKVIAKITSTGYYNIAVIYMMWEDFDKAREYANKGLETGEMQKEFNQILKSCEQYEEYLKKHNITTRYGTIDKSLIL